MVVAWRSLQLLSLCISGGLWFYLLVTWDSGGGGESWQDTNQHLIRAQTQDEREVAYTSADSGVRICSPQERLDRLSRWCALHSPYEKYRHSNHSVTLSHPVFKQKGQGANREHRDLLDLVSDADILKLAHELWMDPDNEVIVCMHAKAGCSTWKALLANNTGPEPMPAHTRSIHTEIFRRGMKCADDGDDPNVIRTRLRSWYKIVIVRHPFDRLVSGFNEKLAGTNTAYMKYVGSQILARYHPHLPKKLQQSGIGVLFQDFIHYILDGAKDDHFNGPYETKCQACLLQYDYVVKLETHDHDANFIVRHKLKGRGLDMHAQIANARRQSGSVLLTSGGRDLRRYYSNLTALQYQKMYRRHAPDLDMYGYSMDNDTFVAKCGTDGCC